MQILSSPPPGFPNPIYNHAYTNVQVSMALIPDSAVDPIMREKLEAQVAMTDEKLMGEEGARIWKEDFAPRDDNHEVIKVPIEWVNFLSMTLLSPMKFEWAKQFVTSNVWEFITQGSEAKVFISFAIPDKFCTQPAPICALQDQESTGGPQQNLELTPPSAASMAGQSASSTSAAHNKKKRKEKLPLVETEVRRSYRSQSLHQGYKKKTCMDKNCLPCHAIPPPIPGKVVKSLVTSFCKANIQEDKGAPLKGGNKKLKSSNPSTSSRGNLKENKGKGNSKN